MGRKTTFSDETSRRMLLIADDLERIETPQNGTPIFLCEMLGSLKYLPDIGIDLVVTSPPYLNGTNYFRKHKNRIVVLTMFAISGRFSSV